MNVTVAPVLDTTRDVSTAAEMLQPYLVEVIGLHLAAKQLHWTVTGREFLPLHGALDHLAADAHGYADEVAEHLAAIGVAPDARLATLASSALPSLPGGFLTGEEAVSLVLERLSILIERSRGLVAGLAGLDPVGQDLALRVLACFEKHLWMFRVQAGSHYGR